MPSTRLQEIPTETSVHPDESPAIPLDKAGRHIEYTDAVNSRMSDFETG